MKLLQDSSTLRLCPVVLYTMSHRIRYCGAFPFYYHPIESLPPA